MRGTSIHDYMTVVPVATAIPKGSADVGLLVG